MLAIFQVQLRGYSPVPESRYDGIRNYIVKVDNAIVPDLTSKEQHGIKELSRVIF
jgi:hypothetical protein